MSLSIISLIVCLKRLTNPAQHQLNLLCILIFYGKIGSAVHLQVNLEGRAKRDFIGEVKICMQHQEPILMDKLLVCFFY